MLFRGLIGAGGNKPISISNITSITSASYVVGRDDLITLPLDIQEGDLLLAVCAAGSTSAGSRYPVYPTVVERYLDGFVGISFIQNFYQYSGTNFYSGVHARTIQYKIADANDAGSSISNFISTISLLWQGVVVFVIRADVPVNKVVSYDFSSYGVLGDPPQYNINSSVTTPISIPIFASSGVRNLPSVAASPTPDKLEAASPDYHGYIYSGIWISNSNATYSFNASDTDDTNVSYDAGTYGSINIT